MENSGSYANIFGLKMLRNRYVVMRHGESEANVLGVAVGDPERGVKGFGLTDFGRQQVVDAAKAFKHRYTASIGETVIIASDFRRTRETAELLADNLGISIPVRIREGLRERSFGELEGKKHRDLAALLESIEMETLINRYGCETAESVQSRAARVIRDIENEEGDKTVILVSHSDPIQFLMAAFGGLDVSDHERILPLNCAEIAELSPGMQLRFKKDVTDCWMGWE